VKLCEMLAEAAGLDPEKAFLKNGGSRRRRRQQPIAT